MNFYCWKSCFFAHSSITPGNSYSPSKLTTYCSICLLNYLNVNIFYLLFSLRALCHLLQGFFYFTYSVVSFYFYCPCKFCSFMSFIFDKFKKISVNSLARDNIQFISLVWVPLLELFVFVPKIV